MYRLYGVELSPYSVKVRSYLRYKEIEHQWIIRRMDKMDEFKQYAKLPIIPLLVNAEDQGMQDSTPIIDALESKHPEKSIVPVDQRLQVLDRILEEFADEWLNKPMFHYRWTYPADQDQAALAIAESQAPEGAPEAVLKQIAEMIKQRMVPRLSFVGSDEKTTPIIEKSFTDFAVAMDIHLKDRSYVFGGRPAIADFALYGQLYELAFDPTPSAWLAENCPNVSEWLKKMDSPTAEGEFESMETLQATLVEMFLAAPAPHYLPWVKANNQAIAAGSDKLEVELMGQAFVQEPQKYHSKSYAVLQKTVEALVGSESEWLTDFGMAELLQA